MVFGSLLLCLAFFFWKCQYGVDLTDEAFYVVSGWKLIPLGDQPFVHEVYNATRQYDLLNFVLTRHLVPFSVYWIRISAIGALALAVYIFLESVFDRKNWGLAALAGVTAVLADEHFLYTWSYNHWAKVMVLLSAALFYSTDSRGSKNRLMLAGLFLGVAAMAYHPLVVVMGLVLLMSIFCYGNQSVFLFGGVLAVWIPNGIYLALHSEAWFAAIFRMMHDSPDYGTIAALPKLFGLWNWTHGSDIFWLTLVGGAACYFPTRKMNWLFILYALFFVVKRVLGFTDVFNRLYVSLATAAFFLLVIQAVRRKRWGLLILCVMSLGSSFVMGVTSVNGVGVMHYAVLPLWIAFFAWIAREDANQVRWVFGGILAYVAILGFLAHGRNTYNDVVPRETRVTLMLPSLKHLKTNARRGFLIQEMAQAVQGKTFVLAFPFLPGAFLFGSRPSVDTTIVHVSFPEEIGQKYLSKMVPNRLPEIAIIAKTHPWSWGRDPVPIEFEKSALYKYAACTKKRLHISYPEFEAWELSHRPECVNR